MQEVISGTSRMVVASGLVDYTLSDEVVILNSKSGVYYGLNAGGVRVWELLQEPHDANQVKVALLNEYDVEPQRCEEEVLALLQHMADVGLIEVDNEGSP